MTSLAGYSPQAPQLLFNEKGLSSELNRNSGDLVAQSSKFKQFLRFALASTHLRPAQLFRFAKRCGYALTPQLFRGIVWQDHVLPRRKIPTSYLTGLRGCTALKVFTFHYMHAFTDATFQPWATNDRYSHFLEFPFIRYFWSGFTSHIFFAVAGYLTSLRLLQLMDDPNPLSQAKVLAMVSASLFRRAFRLYLPVLIITLMTTTYIYFGYYEYNRPFLMNHGKCFPGDWNEEKPPRFPTYYEQLQFWSKEMFDLTNLIWERTVYPWHDQHLWSILSEMRASLHLYVCLIMLAQCTRPIRLVFFAFLAILYFWWNHWEIWVYIGGAMVAQIDIILTEAEQKEGTRLPSSSGEEVEPMCISSTWRLIFPASTIRLPCRFSIHGTRPYIRYLGFFIAFYLLSYPIYGPQEYAPGYMTLNLLIPEWMERKDKFYSNIGTILLLFLLVRSPDHSKWRRFLNSKIPQYLGSIGFGFYLVHGPIMHIFGFMVPQHLWRIVVGADGPNDVTNLQWIAAILCGWVLTLVASLWAADIWTREVEARCGHFTKVLETYCFREKTR